MSAHIQNKGNVRVNIDINEKGTPTWRVHKFPGVSGIFDRGLTLCQHS